MESQEHLVNGGDLNGGGIVLCGTQLEQVNGRVQVGCYESGKENLADEVLEDLEEYWEHINDRLIISRMVSDAVIKGMMTAVEQEAAEKIAAKELELVNLKEYLESHGVGGGRFEDVNFLSVEKESKIGEYGRISCLHNTYLELEMLCEQVCTLRNFAREQLNRVNESALQKMTEEYFCLRRDYPRERKSLTQHRKGEEFDVLQKKIPEVISKLEDFLQENEKFPALINSLEVTGKQRHRVESLLSENCHLRDCLADMKNEVNRLEAQISGKAATLLEPSLCEKSMIKLIENLKSEVEDSQIAASLNEEIYKCASRTQRRCEFEESYMELLVTQEIYNIILQEASVPAETVIKYDYEDSDLESSIVQELSGIIFKEAFKDAGQKFKKWNHEVHIDKEAIISLQTKYLQKEIQLNREVEEQEKLKQEILDLKTDIKEKETVAADLSVSLSKEREQFEHASIELCILRENASQQQMWLTERSRELELLRSQHLKAVKYIEVGKMEMEKLNQMLDQTKEMLMETKKERNTALSSAQQMRDKLLSVEFREENLKIDMKMAVNGLLQAFENFQCTVSEAIKDNTSRMVHVVRRTGLMYEKELERRCADLQMAETEVDLLGDEVDAMLGLLKRIYAALDHYSPVLKHYPGIVEILELVRRELSGEFTKPC